MTCDHCGRAREHAARGRPRRYCSRSCQARAYRARKDGGSHGSPKPAPAAPPGQADRDTAVTAAIALADAEGLHALTMRVLAARLAITTTTLYRHISSKDALVTHMMSRVLDEYRPPDRPPKHWREQLRHEARQEWELYRRHPWLLPVLATTRPPLSDNLLAAVDRPISALHGLGISHHLAMSVYLVVSGFVQGAAQLLTAETRLADHTGVELDRWWWRQEPRLSGAVNSGRYPWLSAMSYDPDAAIDLDAWFDFGLERVLDGIAQLLASQAPG